MFFALYVVPPLLNVKGCSYAVKPKYSNLLLIYIAAVFMSDDAYVVFLVLMIWGTPFKWNVLSPLKSLTYLFSESLLIRFTMPWAK